MNQTRRFASLFCIHTYLWQDYFFVSVSPATTWQGCFFLFRLAVAGTATLYFVHLVIPHLMRNPKNV